MGEANEDVRFEWGFPPRFPDICVGCGQAHPGDSIQVRWWQCSSFDPVVQLWIRISRSPFDNFQIPACGRCKSRHARSRRVATMVYLVVVYPAAIASIIFVGKFFSGPELSFKKMTLRRVFGIVPAVVVWFLAFWIMRAWPIVGFKLRGDRIHMTAQSDEF